MDGRASLEPVLQSQVPELLQQLAPDWSDHLIGDDRPDRTKGGSVWIAKPSLTNGGAGVELVPTAGALLVCDIPHDRMREFRHGAIEVSTKVRTTHRSLLPALFLDSNDDDQFTKTGSGQT